MTAPIRKLLFDIGIVLVHLDYAEGARQLAPLCEGLTVSHEGYLRMFRDDPILAQYEKGEISREQFLDHFLPRLRFRGDPEQFVRIWRSICRANQPMIDFARSLSSRYDIYFLSNTGEMHVPYVYDRFPDLRCFKGDALSYRIGALKPERAFYERALRRLDLRAEECLFIDDRPENIEGAEACGLRSILYTRAEETIRAVTHALAEG